MAHTIKLANDLIIGLKSALSVMKQLHSHLNVLYPNNVAVYPNCFNRTQSRIM
ncbi:MAG: hypothetical protein ACI81Y_002924, partial [Glaciecola sp.]